MIYFAIILSIVNCFFLLHNLGMLSKVQAANDALRERAKALQDSAVVMNKCAVGILDSSQSVQKQLAEARAFLDQP